MYLIFDPSTPEQLRLYYAPKPPAAWQSFVPAPGIAPTVAAAQFCQEKNILPSDLRGLGVVLGVGRFTATRLCAVAANTLGFAYGIPVVAITPGEQELFWPQFTVERPGQYVSAVYSGPPRAVVPPSAGAERQNQNI